jgi:hypothetical protein
MLADLVRCACAMLVESEPLEPTRNESLAGCSLVRFIRLGGCRTC